MNRSTRHVPSIRHAVAGLVACALTLTGAPVAHAVDDPATCETVTATWDFSTQPIEISSADDLYCIGEGGIRPDGDGNPAANTLEADYLLTANVDLTTRTIGTVWRPIGSSADPFIGTLDGGDHAITGLSIDLRGDLADPDDGTSNVGLFGKTSDGAIITDIQIVNPQVKGKELVGSLVGEAQGTSVANVTVLNATISADGNGPGTSEAKVGGLVGRAYNTSITHVSVTETVVSVTNSEAYELGGIVGRLDADRVDEGGTEARTIVSDAVFSGEVTGVGSMGGIVGAADTPDTNGVKGIRVTNVRSSGSVSTIAGVSGWYIGGALGIIYDAELSEIHSSSTVSATGGEVGGAIGSIGDSRLDEASATGNVNVTADQYGWCAAGGLIGSSFRAFRDLAVTQDHRTPNEYPLFQDLSAEGNVSCTAGDAVGGLVGFLQDTTIRRASASGSVTGVTATRGEGEAAGPRNVDGVGGIAGWVDDSLLEDVSATSPVTTEGKYVGGIVGIGHRTLSIRRNSDNTGWDGSDAARSTEIVRGSSSGAVRGSAYVGGLVGEGVNNDDTNVGGVLIRQSVSTSSVKGKQGVGGVFGGSVGDVVLEDVLSSGSVTGWEEADGDEPASGQGHIGGLAGHVSDESAITRAYSVSMVTTDTSPDTRTVGALVGVSSGELNGPSYALNSEWPTIGSAPEQQQAKAVGRTSDQLKALTTFSVWNTDAGVDVIVSGAVALSSRTTQVWGLCSNVNSGYPFLQWQRSEACGGSSEPTSQQDPASSGGSGSGSGGTGAQPGSASVGAAQVTPVRQVATPQAPSTTSTRPTGLPGLEVVSGIPADSVRVMRKPVGSTVATAPTVTAVAGQPVALAVRGLVPRSTVDVRVRSRGKSASLGSVVVAADGSATLPAFRARGASRITIALVDAASGSSSFVKVEVQQARSKPKARAGADRRAR